MRIFVTGSIAYDYIMVFPGRFRDHILPDKMHVLSRLVSGRLADAATGRDRGEHRVQPGAPGRAAAAGRDRRRRLRRVSPWLESHGVDCRTVEVIAGRAHGLVLHQYRLAGQSDHGVLSGCHGSRFVASRSPMPA